MKSSIRALLIVLMMACSAAAWAQAGGAQSEEGRARPCPDGQYLGPREGAQSFYEDPYVWFVSREFARRFCMPERYIDDSLKGALALAIRLQPEEFTLCGFIGGPKQCPAKKKLLIDLYIDNRQVTLPKADASVSYYSGWVENSAWIMGVDGPRMFRRIKGEITEEVGERRPFSPLTKPHQPREKVKLIYMGARKDWVTGSGIFTERFYRANWAHGIDLLTLDGYMFGYKYVRNPDKQIQTEPSGGRGYYDEKFDRTDPIRHLAIAFLRGSEFYDRYKQDIQLVPYPAGFDHVIVVPHKVAQIVYQYDWHEGEIFFNRVTNAMKAIGISVR